MSIYLTYDARVPANSDWVGVDGTRLSRLRLGEALNRQRRPVCALNYVRKNVIDVGELYRRFLPVGAGRRNNPAVRTRARLTEWFIAATAPSALRRIDP